MARLLENLAIFLLITASTAMAAPPCPTIVNQLAGCVSYIEGQSSDAPPSACCVGVRAVAGEQKNQKDKVAICNCIKQALSNLGHQVDRGRLTHLPKKCGLDFDFPPIDSHYDCSQISWK